MRDIEDVRKVLRGILSPELKAIDTRLTALESQLDSHHFDTMSAIRQVSDYTSVVQRLAKLEGQPQAQTTP